MHDYLKFHYSRIDFENLKIFYHVFVEDFQERLHFG